MTGKNNIYAISSDELILCEERMKELRIQAEKDGFNEHRRFVLDDIQDKDALLLAAQNSSLFAAKVLIEIRCRQLTKETEALLTEVLMRISTDILLLIALPYLPKAQRKKKCVSLLETKGRLEIIYPPQEKEYIQWLKQRSDRIGLNISDQAVALIADHHLGSMHTAAQELEKLALYYDKEKVEYHSLTLTDDIHYEAFALSDGALKGDAVKCRRILHRLRTENTPPYLLIGALTRDLRTLWVLSEKSHSPNWAQLGAQSFRRALISQALPRFSNQRKRLLSLLRMAALADRAAKGGSDDDVWQLIEGLALRIAGISSPSLIHHRR